MNNLSNITFITLKSSPSLFLPCDFTVSSLSTIFFTKNNKYLFDTFEFSFFF